MTLFDATNAPCVGAFPGGGNPCHSGPQMVLAHVVSTATPINGERATLSSLGILYPWTPVFC